MPGIEFRDVARLLGCKEFAEAEGLKLRGGRAVCVFHAGADGYNLAFYPDGKCHCHKCGRTADVVQLAAAVWSCNQREAASELNRRYRLGLDGKRLTAAEVDKLHHRQRQRDVRQAEAEAALHEAQAEARAAWAAVNACNPEAEGYDELLRQAKNADTWLHFKTVELSLIGGGEVTSNGV